MAHFNKEKALETIKSGDMDDIQALLDDLEERLNTKKYGLIWEHGGDDEDSAFEPEYVVLDYQHKLPYPKLREDLSTNPDKANGNMLLEGDNYIWLKILEQTHAGKIDIIYIDPPYGTGKKDFKYNDVFVDPEDTFRHSKWLDFMSKRLEIAKRLLSDDGVMFLSIGDDSQAELKLLCNEIFGEKNFIEEYIWESTFKPDNSSPILRRNAEFILCFAKDKANIKGFKGILAQTSGMPSLTKAKETVKTISFHANSVHTTLPDGIYSKGVKGNGDPLDWELVEDAEARDGIFITPVIVRGHSYWATQKKILNELADGTEIWIKSNNFIPYYKKAKDAYVRPTKILPRDLVRDYGEANAAMKKIFLSRPFTNPKPTPLLRFLLEFTDKKDAKVLDFFAGSGTTAQAIEELNKTDGGHRQWVLITNNEDQDEDDGDPETGICRDITKPRIDTVITGIRPDGSQYGEGTDSGYQYFQYDFMPRYESREANQRAFFTPTKNVDAIVRMTYGVILKELDRDRMAMTYESDMKQLIVFIKNVDENLMNEFFDDEHEHIVLANDIVDVDGVESKTIHSLVPSYEFFL